MPVIAEPLAPELDATNLEFVKEIWRGGKSSESILVNVEEEPIISCSTSTVLLETETLEPSSAVLCVESTFGMQANELNDNVFTFF